MDGSKTNQPRDLSQAEGAPPDATLPDGPAPDAPVTHDGGPCQCKSGEVWLRSACVPTVKLGCGATCQPNTPGSCPTGWSCDPCAAAPSCTASACRPACVPGMAMGFASGSLRVTPTLGVAGKPVTLTVTGGKFYIGAMFWEVSLGGATQIAGHPSDCTVTATLTPTKPGLFPVEVRYTNGSKPALAGFYLASGGSIPPVSAQPGYPCSPSLKCAQATPYTCACISGRCQCK